MNWTRRPKKQAILGKKHAGFFLLSHHRLRRRPAPAPCSATFLSLPCCDRARSTAALFRSTKKGGGLAHEGHKSERARERERERRVSFFCLFFFFDSALFSFSLSLLSLSGTPSFPKREPCPATPPPGSSATTRAASNGGASPGWRQRRSGSSHGERERERGLSSSETALLRSSATQSIRPFLSLPSSLSLSPPLPLSNLPTDNDSAGTAT